MNIAECSNTLPGDSGKRPALRPLNQTASRCWAKPPSLDATLPWAQHFRRTVLGQRGCLEHIEGDGLKKKRAGRGGPERIDGPGVSGLETYRQCAAIH